MISLVAIQSLSPSMVTPAGILLCSVLEMNLWLAEAHAVQYPVVVQVVPKKEFSSTFSTKSFGKTENFKLSNLCFTSATNTRSALILKVSVGQHISCIAAILAS